MDHLACFTAGMFALGSHTIKSAESAKHMQVAEQLGNTCHESYARTSTGLGPESFRLVEAETVNCRTIIVSPFDIETNLSNI